MADLPRIGQGWIPLGEWRRFVRVADWFDRTFGFTSGVNPDDDRGDIVVMTPTEGIPARAGRTMYSALCKLQGLSEATAGEVTITELTDRTVRVYNSWLVEVPGNRLVTAGFLRGNKRYVKVASCDEEPS